MGQRGRSLGGEIGGMRILITGGFGFVGGRLAQTLLNAGHAVTLASRTARVCPVELTAADTVQWDWRDDCELRELCAGFDVLVHAAGMNAQESAANPAAALEVNGLATARLVAAAGAAGVKRFIYLSTAHVYGGPLVGTVTESTCPKNLHPYATSHLAGEHAVLHAGSKGVMHGVVLRLSNAFGAPVNKNANCWMLLANDLCLQAVKKRQLVLHTQGTQQRDFIAMDSVCKAIQFYVDLGLDQTGQEVLNLGAGRSLSVLAIAQLVQQRCLAVFGFTPPLVLPQGGPQETNETLKYCVDKLRDRGCQLTNNYEKEMDKLLVFCRDQML